MEAQPAQIKAGHVHLLKEAALSSYIDSDDLISSISSFVGCQRRPVGIEILDDPFRAVNLSLNLCPLSEVRAPWPQCPGRRLTWRAEGSVSAQASRDMQHHTS
jgi:hypothetical protein